MAWPLLEHWPLLVHHQNHLMPLLQVLSWLQLHEHHHVRQQRLLLALA
jgi:hypothetical protein